jgi:PilZ domain-containing protein
MVTNITTAKQETGSVLDISSCGMRLKTTIAAIPGDALRIDLAEFTLLAEVIHCEATPLGIEMGVRLLHSLKRQQWRQLIGPDSRDAEWSTRGEVRCKAA